MKPAMRRAILAALQQVTTDLGFTAGNSRSSAQVRWWWDWYEDLRMAATNPTAYDSVWWLHLGAHWRLKGRPRPGAEDPLWRKGWDVVDSVIKRSP